MDQILNYGKDIFADGLAIFLIKVILVAVISKLLIKIIEKYLIKVIPDNKSAKTVTPIFLTTLKVLIYGIAIFSMMASIIPLKSFGQTILGASSIFAVIVGLAAQETLGNFVAGIILSIYQPFYVGDMIVIKEKNISGKVKAIGLRHTVLRTPENTDIVIPNSVMNTAIIENRDLSDKSYRNTLTLNVAYESDLDFVKEVIMETISKNSRIIDNRNTKQKKNNEPVIKIYFSDFKDFSIEIKVIFFTDDFVIGYEVSSELRESIKKVFDEKGIIIPYPTRIVKNS